MQGNPPNQNGAIQDGQDWPVPDQAALEQSRELSMLIRHEIDACGGSIGFDRYMEMALYAPGLGYYSAGARKFGRDGDFITAPETSALFSVCLARQCQQVLSRMPAAQILELGAGTGRMAADLLDELKRLQSVPDRYLILERSAELRQRQQQLLQQRHNDIFGRLVWLDSLPDRPMQGVIVANEVLDALPVHRLIMRQGKLHELCVGRQEEEFIWLRTERPFELGDIPDPLIRELPDGYSTEFCAQLSPFIGSLADTLGDGLILLIDYGYPRAEYYLPQRVQGTLACYYRHRQHDNPFIHIGIQDITASVDFTQVAESAHAQGLQVCGYTNQASFLIACGLPEILATPGGRDEKDRLQLAQQAGRLLLPGGMGETFKVIGLGKQIDYPLLGFGFANQLHRL